MGKCTRISREHGQDCWSEVAKGIFYTTECHAQDIKLLQFDQELLSVLGGSLSSVWWTNILSITCFCWVLFANALDPQCIFIAIVIILIFSFVSVIAHLNTRGLLFLLIPISAGGEVSQCVVLDCHLGLNCERHRHFQQSIAEYLGVQTGQNSFVCWAAGPFSFPKNTEGLISWVF